MGWMNMVHNRVNLKVNAGPRLTARVELRNRAFFGSQVRKTPGFGSVIDSYPGFFDLSVLWVDHPSWVAHSVVDRLSVAYSIPKWDIVLRFVKASFRPTSRSPRRQRCAMPNACTV
jgi:hypothetical protein